jgi:hypothetical protein
MPGAVAQGASPAVDLAGHPMVGAWQVGPVSDECCLVVFTSDGLVINVEAVLMPGEQGPLSRVSIGAWEPTGDTTATSVFWFRTGDGGFVEYRVDWEISPDGQTLSGSAVVTFVNADGTSQEATASVTATRLTAASIVSAGSTPDATPAS